MFPSPPSSLQSHLAAELLALTVQQLFSQAVLVDGGPNSLGFYYDFIFEQPLTESMRELIEVHLHRLIREDPHIRSISMMRENAQALFEYRQEFFLAQRVGQEHSNIVDLIQIDDFYDLCPTLSFTSAQEVGCLKLLGFYSLPKMIHQEEVIVTRLFGAVQNHAKDLKLFLKAYDIFLKKRDHRLLGEKLRLFHLSERREDLGVLWFPKGMQLRKILQEWLRKLLPELNREISTPSFYSIKDGDGSCSLVYEDFEGEKYPTSSSLTKQHLQFFQKFPPLGEEFPWKISETKTIFRNYPESQQWGLFCHCSYLTEQTTLCCLKEQVLSELISSLLFIEQIITIFDFEARWCLIVAQQKEPRLKREREAIAYLRQAAETPLRAYPFYSEPQQGEDEEGPRLELRIRDSLGREWPISSLRVLLQAEIANPEQDDLAVVIRCIWESLDRFIALLVEHHQGNFPFWMAPEQVRVIAIGKGQHPYAQEVVESLKRHGIRVTFDRGQDKLSKRIHEAEKEQIPYLVLIGEKEKLKQKMTIRPFGGGDHSHFLDLETFLSKIYQESLYPIHINGKDKFIGENESA